MGTSARPSVPPGVVPANNDGGGPGGGGNNGLSRGSSSGSGQGQSASVLRRRDSGGSCGCGATSGTAFLTHENVVVRGRRSPTTHHLSGKEERGAKPAERNVNVPPPSSVPTTADSDDATPPVHHELLAASSCACCSDGSACTDRAVDASELFFDIDAMEEMEEMEGDGCWDDDDDDDDISAARRYFLAETLGAQRQLSNGPVSRESDADRAMASSWSSPPSSQPIAGSHAPSSQGVAPSPPALCHRSSSPSASSFGARSPSPPASASTDAKALARSMRRIIDLNRSAMDQHLAGGDARLVLDTLHKAEWVRSRLAHDLAAAMHGAMRGRDECVLGDMETTSPAALSRPFGGVPAAASSSAEEETRRTKCPRRSSDGDRRRDEEPSTSAPNSLRDPLGDHVARTSYIYQRMDFDEGMHGFADLEAIDPAAFWLPADDDGLGGGLRADDGNVATTQPPCEMSPVVEATLVFNVGQVHRRGGDLDAASGCYDRALHILRSRLPRAAPEDVHPLLIPLLHNVGQLRYRRGDIRLATETYGLALRRARAMYGGRHPHVASALNCLGVLGYHDANLGDGSEEEGSEANEAAVVDANSGDNVIGGNGSISTSSTSGSTDNKQQQQQQHSSTQKAMDLFQQALSIRVEALGPDHVDVATALNNIGRIHVQLDEFDQALGYYEDALRIRRAALGVDSLDYAATAFNAGQSLHQRGDLTRALELYHEFLRVALARFGRGHRDVAVVLSGIAQIHQERREHDRALELYEASLHAGRAALGEDHSEIAMLLNRMGNFHFERERLDDALRCYRRGLRIERRVLPPDHPNVVVTLSNLGEIHRQRAEWDDAARMYGDCLDVLRRKHGGRDHADVASTLSTLGLVQDQRGDACLSLGYLQDALLMRRRLLGNDHLDVAATLVYIGTILYRKGVLAVAMELFAEALRVRRAALGDDHRDVAFVMYNIALVHQQRGCYEEAIESYAETLRVEKIVLGEGHRDVAMTLFKLGEANKAAGDQEEALRCFQESLAVERGLSSPSPSTAPAQGHQRGQRPQQSTGAGGPDHAAMARALNEIGNIHMARGDVVPMMDALNEASRMYREAGLSPSNVVVSGALYALEFSCPEAAPAA